MKRWQLALISTIMPSPMLLGLGKLLDYVFVSVARSGVFYLFSDGSCGGCCSRGLYNFNLGISPETKF